MGFNYYNLGNIHPCWIEGGYVCHEVEVSHSIYRYQTALELSLPRQQNIFYSHMVAFWLQDTEKEYIGRYDGVISIYRRSDNMLVGLSNWKAPFRCATPITGFYLAPTGKSEVFLDSRDGVTVYTKYKAQEGLLERKIVDPFSDALGVITDNQFNGQESCMIFDRGGDSVAVNIWYPQDSLWRRDCRVYL